MIRLQLGDESAMKGLSKTKAGAQQSRTGQDSYELLYRSSLRNLSNRTADYTSPSLLVMEIKGRGLVTKKAVKAGELLMLANPFASVTAKDFNTTGRLRPRRRRQPVCLAGRIGRKHRRWSGGRGVLHEVQVPQHRWTRGE